MVNTHNFRKRFGQNFLHDNKVIHQIIYAINPQATEHLVEIGPGLGAITALLLQSSAKLDIIELDHTLVPKLQTKFANYHNLTIHQADILKFDLARIINTNPKLRIVGNLPYNISTPLLFKLLTYQDNIVDLHVMLQKEVAERLIATPGNKNYGRLSIMIQYYYQVTLLFTVPASCFTPIPKVTSAFVRLNPQQQLTNIASNFNEFKNLVTKAFNQRRKTILNTLKPIICQEELTKLGIDPSLRPEQLTSNDYLNISNFLVSKNLSITL